MSVKKALVAMLRADAGLVAAVGNRIYPEAIPQHETKRPALTYTVIDRPRVRHLGGYAGLAHPRVQVDTWATSAADADTVAGLLRTALRPQRLTVAGVGIQGIWLDGEQDFYEPPLSSEAVGIYRVSQDFIIWHDE
jgi:hypothetical protein